MKEYKMFVVCHKQNNLKLKNNYEKIYVNAIKNNFINFKYNDAMTKDNISLKNPNYCELTAIYALDNLNLNLSEIGISHYRRFFCRNFISCRPISLKTLNNYLRKFDIILPYKVKFKQSVYEQYKFYHRIEDLEEAIKITLSMHPELKEITKRFLNSKEMVSYNMFYCSFDLFKEYCCRLFPILFKLEKNIDISSLDPFQSRVFGFISERLFNIWIMYKKLNVKNICIVKTDKGFFKKRLLLLLSLLKKEDLFN